LRHASNGCCPDSRASHKPRYMQFIPARSPFNLANNLLVTGTIIHCKDQLQSMSSSLEQQNHRTIEETVNTTDTALESCLWCYLAIARSLILDSNIGDAVSETSRASSCSSASLTACIALQISATYVDFPIQNRRKCERFCSPVQ
jgi:hypothetical protein